MDKQLSRAFTLIRFPLAILVIVLHILPMPNIKFYDFDWINFAQGSWLYFPLVIIGVTLARLAVPTFFFMSGFLLYYGIKNLTINIYLCKLRKRFLTLFVPYIFWNVLAFVYLIITNQNPEYSLYKIFIAPANFPLWFLRDLIILVFFSPLLYWVVRYLKFVGLIIITLLFVFGINIPDFFIVEMVSIYFVYLGIYFSFYNISFKDIAKYKVYIYSITSTLFLLNIIFYGNVNVIISHLYLIFIVISALLFFYLLKLKDSINKYLTIFSTSTFFIYVSHKNGFTYISKLPFTYFSNSLYVDSLIFVLCPIITSFLCIIVFYLLSKINNRFINILIGFK